jgi:predicted metal-dependent peptidase
MIDDLVDQAEAEALLRLARRRMATAYPFHASLLCESRFEAAAVGTMAVTIRDRVTILYAPEFVLQCSIPELTGVLHHEVNHVLFGHLFDDPARFPDHEALVIAQETCVNEWVTEPLPCDPILLAQFPQLPPREDTAQRYHRLASRAGKRGRSVPKGASSVPKNGPSGTKKPSSGAKKPSAVHPLDDHGVWQEVRNDSRLAKLAAAVAVRSARKNLSPQDLAKLPDELKRQLHRWAADGTAGNFDERVGPFGLGETGIGWRHRLQRYVGRALVAVPQFNRPPRRFPELVGIVPGRSRRPTKPRILAAIDTSASLGAQALSQISGELARLASSHEVVIVECDAEIQLVYEYCEPIQHVHGRGGTDFRPVFQPAFLKRQRADLIVYFTDGDGPAPPQRPVPPVIWCLTEGGRRPTSWGAVIQMCAAT